MPAFEVYSCGIFREWRLECEGSAPASIFRIGIDVLTYNLTTDLGQLIIIAEQNDFRVRFRIFN